MVSKTFTTQRDHDQRRDGAAWLRAALGRAAVAAFGGGLHRARQRRRRSASRPTRCSASATGWAGAIRSGRRSASPAPSPSGCEAFEAFLAGGRGHGRAFPHRAAGGERAGAAGAWRPLQPQRLGRPARAVVPYAQRLHLLPAFLQQLEMESNGKRVTPDGRPVARHGRAGVRRAGHQRPARLLPAAAPGDRRDPADFMAAARGATSRIRPRQQHPARQRLAQAEALMRGRTPRPSVRASCPRMGRRPSDATRSPRSATFPGDRPSTTSSYGPARPAHAGRAHGALRAQGLRRGRDLGHQRFDQWGVELGKELATSLLPLVAGEAPLASAPPSTRGLAAALKDLAAQA